MPAAVILPHASTRPAGSTTLGMSLDERSGLRDGVLMLALGCLGVGLAGGYVLGLRRAAARRNPSASRSKQRRDSLP